MKAGKFCNQTPVHCHVNAEPGCKEIMSRATIDRIVDWLARTDIRQWTSRAVCDKWS